MRYTDRREHTHKGKTRVPTRKGVNTMQQVTNYVVKNTSPAYVERILLFLTPSGNVAIRIGNTMLQATPEEALAFLQSRLTHHGQSALVLTSQESVNA